MGLLTKRSTPGVYLQEKDLSERVQPIGTSTGAVVVRAKKGRINYPQIVTNDKEYVDNFGAPVYVSGTSTSDTETPEMGYGGYAAVNFLQESNRLYVVRDYASGDKYATVQFTAGGSTSATSADGVDATADPNGVPDDLDTIYTLDEAIETGNSLLIGAVGPGTDGNNIAVTLETFHANCDWINAYDDYTSATASSAHPIAADVFKIQVYTKEDTETWSEIAFSAISASPVETFYGTRDSQQDGNKKQLKISDVVNGVSSYIYVVPGTADFTEGGSLATVPTDKIPLSGGAISYGTNIGSTDGWSYFESKTDTSPSILICPDYSMAVKKEVARIAAARKDCIGVGQAGQRANTTVATVKAAEEYGYTDPSYMALYAGWDKWYDKYNDKNVFLPKCIFGAGLMARTDTVANTWDAPAFINRGVLGSSIGQKVRFNNDQVGQLYDVNINTSLNIKGVGDVMWGQKTAQQKASALDRINVRRLLLFIEGSIEQSLYPFIGQPNNATTRLRVYNIIDSFLSLVQAGGGFDDTEGSGYSVLCDASNNTAAIRDANKLVVQIYVKPIRIIEFIELQTIITQSGISFSEIVSG